MTCEAVGAACGHVSDGCNAALDCGACDAPDVCGGAGVDNQCGCTPKSCAQLGAECGDVDTGCGIVNCGACTQPDTCGGAGIDNRCGCQCTLDHATTSCHHGVCTVADCESGWGDCDSLAASGCETDLRSSDTDCAVCGHACVLAHSSATCQQSLCRLGTCVTDYANCDADEDNGCETNLTSDVEHCGTCDHVCPSNGGTPVCTVKVCGMSACDPDLADCDPNVAGCETDTTSSSEHCGACNNPCTYSYATGVCSASACELGACWPDRGNCDGNDTNGCETNTGNSITHCGSCATPCPARAHSTVVCSAGACSYTCDQGWADWDGIPATGCETDIVSDATHCGACSTVCDVANAVAACVGGACYVGQCSSGYADCDSVAANGCEVSTTDSLSNCGACFRACSSAHGVASCNGGTCSISCSSGYKNCNGSLEDGCETNTMSDPNHCGSCGGICSGDNISSRSCLNGACNADCYVGYDDCNHDKLTDGCEADVSNDILNCGTCGQVCPATGGTPQCNAGTCSVSSCPVGFRDCDGLTANGCEVDATTDPNNCGGCGRACVALHVSSRSCTAGVCSSPCTSGYGDCNGNKLLDGCESNLTNDPEHCGTCATNCTSPTQPNAAGVDCVSSACAITACSSGYYDQNHVFSGGCECAADNIGNVCGAGINLGTVAQGSTMYFPSTSGMYNITPSGGTTDEDWFAVTFANTATCSYRPKITLQDLSGTGLIKMQLFTSACGTATGLTCNGSGEAGNASSQLNLTTWELRFSGTCGDLMMADPSPASGVLFSPTMISSVRIRAYTTAASTTCLPYRLVISNAP